MKVETSTSSPVLPATEKPGSPPSLPLLSISNVPQQRAEQQSVQSTFAASGEDALNILARNLDYHASYNPDFGYGQVEFYGITDKTGKTVHALTQAGIRYHPQDSQMIRDASETNATTFYAHFHPWTRLRGVIKKKPLRIHIPLHASEQTVVAFFTLAEQHVKTSPDNEKIVLAATGKMITSLLLTRPEWFTQLSDKTKSDLISGKDTPELHRMAQMLPDNAPLLQRFINNHYYEWRNGAFRRPVPDAPSASS